MATIEELAERLEIASQLLNGAAEDIRDLPFEPVGETLRTVGEALGNIRSVQHAIFQFRPELQPELLRYSSPDPEANKRLAASLTRAYRLTDAGCFDEAVALLTEYAFSEASELHKRIALHEKERIRGLSK